MFELFAKKRGNWKDDVLSGFTVALALVPEAIAFSLLIGVPPLIGLWAAVFMAFITSALGGRPGMISGATGAIVVVLHKALTYGELQGEGMGMQYLFAVVMLAGLFQIIFGLLKLGRFVRLVPHPVMMGFVNGLAVLIFLAQFKSFQTPDGDWLPSSQLQTMGGLALLTMLIIYFLPKVTRAVPATLVSILSVGLISYFLVDTKTVSDVLFEGTGSS
ncbi:MAG: SulP family inorganic anion transporter, partial [Kiritimatiellae bacterium]|nr:SulP family inorganic anion transporter [Kiritimatiellia bacterium]